MQRRIHRKHLEAKLANRLIGSRFLPMRTASTVARGSWPRSLPVKISSKYAKTIATACGTFMLGDGSPVSADKRSRICFSVRFSPPRI
jgi:hypothetical protein